MDTTEQNLKLGKWLKAKRKVAGLTPSQLAKVIGRPASFIKRQGTGKNGAKLRTTKAITSPKSLWSAAA